ncbi:NAD(P)-dependent oxidoreductase [Microbacterium lushaniae]|uniref:NAD(P)-dependent oxidoreductase n=1 Tax=Microbacterium lushaniae TaxID=2614639 RepID=A0A5J6L7H1_9MICO|nr:NAD(P)-dependent oxidoreductase [Microbacterium lushaniae]QEW04350.1 NAD(P)-dependent oxidoreductase [Microbacterium lushaniae]
MSTVGFLGLGSMGRGMAARLVDAGHDVRVWNRSEAPVTALVERGATAATVEEALAADVSFSMLADDDAVQEVLTPATLTAASGRIHVVMASISPALADRLEHHLTEAGAGYVAAPVLGRPEVAAAGQLNILAAGPAGTVETVMPYLEAMGKRVWRLGETASAANAVKVAVNYNIIHALQAIGESVAMTERLGVPAEDFTELLSQTLFGGVVYGGYGRIIAAESYHPPGFHMSLGRKDLALAEEVAASVGVTPATLPGLIRVFETALADPDLKSADWSAIAEVSRRDLL